MEINDGKKGWISDPTCLQPELVGLAERCLSWIGVAACTLKAGTNILLNDKNCELGRELGVTFIYIHKPVSLYFT